MNKSFVYSTVSRIIFSAFSISYLWSYAKLLSIQDFSQFALFDSARLFLCTAPAWGCAQALIRNATKSKLNLNVIYTGLFIQLIFAIISTFIVVIYYIIKSLYYNNLSLVSIDLLYIPLFIISFYLYQFIKSFLLSAKDMKLLCYQEGSLLIPLLAILLTIHLSSNSISFLCAVNILTSCYLVSSLVTLVFLTNLSVFNSMQKLQLTRKELIDQLHYIKFSIPNNITSNIFNMLDMVIVSSILGPSITATYKASKIFGSLYTIIGEAFNYTVFTEIASFGIYQYEHARSILSKYSKFALAISAPISLILIIFGYNIFDILYSGKYSNFPGIRSLMVCTAIWGFGFIFNRINGTFLGAIGLPKIQFIITLISSLIGIVTLPTLSSYFSLTGVGLSIVITMITTSFLIYYYDDKLLKSLHYTIDKKIIP